MKKLHPSFSLLIAFFLLLATVVCGQTQIVSSRQNEVFLKTDLSSANQLNYPWEVIYGPDDSLWITESRGYKIYKMSPNGGTKKTILNIDYHSTFLGSTPASDSIFNLQFTFSTYNPQGGLAGMAIHPQFNSGKNFVYVSYIRSYDSTASGNKGAFFKNRVVRFTYNPATGKLQNPVSLCDTLPGSSDHNSQRLIIAPVNGTYYLFYAAGDMGAGQFANQYRTNNAQKVDKYEGKILRFNLESDGETGLDGWIPNDNPYNGSTQSAVWSIGIRNNQGFAYDSIRNILYGSSHGPYSDDEINMIQPTKNYGHPLVIGYAADHNYDSSSAGAFPTSAIDTIKDEVAAAALIGPSYMDPIFTAYPQPTDTIKKIWRTQPGNGGWPSEAWSGMGWYNYSIIPDWKGSLVLSGLKWGRLIRTRLNSAGTTIVPTNGADTVTYFDSNNRYRDIDFGPGGKDIYVIMDNSSATSGPGTNNPSLVGCQGCLQKFTFLGYNTVSGTSAIPTSVKISTTALNACESGNTITIDNNNKNLWVPITDTNSNIIAEINPNGNILGTVTTSVYTNGNAVRERASNHALYLDRNITITPQFQPGSAVSIRLYLTNAEFTALKNATNSMSQPSGVITINDLSIFKNADPCGSAISLAPIVVTSSNKTAFGSGGYVIQGSISSFSTFYMAGVSSLLPVNLTSFRGMLSNGISMLNWTTENQIQTTSFNVERSSNGRDFYTVGTVAAYTDGRAKADYAFPDSTILKVAGDAAYYRLKIFDGAGRYSYSDVVKINLTSIHSVLSIRPNPVFNEVTLSINASVGENAVCELTDVSGKTVLQQSVILNKGNNTISFKLGKLPAGMYYLKVSGNNINQAVKMQKL